MEKTLKDYQKLPRLTSFSGLEIGSKIVIVANSNSHNYPMGKILTVRIPCSGVACTDFVKEFQGNTLNAADCVKVEINDKEAFEAAISRLQHEISEYKNKLDFLNAMGTEKFDYKEYQIYGVLETIESKKSKTEKVKAIRKLI